MQFLELFRTICDNECCFLPAGAGPAPTAAIGPNWGQKTANFGQFWSSSLAKSAIFRGKALHRKLAIFIIFHFHYWRTVESCRTYHFFQVDWTKIWSIFAIITNQKFSNERVNQIQKEMWHLKVNEIKLMWSKWISEMKTLHKNISDKLAICYELIAQFIKWSRLCNSQ